MADIPTLDTARLKLRGYRLQDFDAYAALWADPEVVRYIGGVPFSREAAWTRFVRQVGMWQLLGFGFFAVEHAATGAFVGEVGFHDLHRTLIPSVEGTMEVGWVVTTAVQGQGLAAEAMRAALGWAAEHGTGARLTCMIDPANAPSLRLAAKLDFAEFTRTTYNGKPVVLLERPRLA